MAFVLPGCEQQPTYDHIIRNGVIYDGTGVKSFTGDVGIRGDSIAFIGDLKNEKGKTETDAAGKAIAPGFINMQSWADISLIQDGRSLSDLKQGVTLEVFGEGTSEGTANDTMRKLEQAEQGDIRYKIQWRSQKEFLEYLVARGISTNVASFVGATSIRQYVLGDIDRAPDSVELEKMKALTDQAMREGALGIGSALIYAPAFYAHTNELVALCKVAAAYDGVYISHIRSEGNRLLEGADELISISRQANIPAIFYHLKAAGKNNWYKMDLLIAKIDSARKQGLDISACMYTYTAAATGLDATMPPSVQEGGLNEWTKRLKDPAVRKKLITQMSAETNDWENYYTGAGPDHIIVTDFKQDSLKYLVGKTISEIAAMRHTSPQETIIDLVVQDHSRVGTIFFLMDEENLRKEIKLPYVTFGSDAASIAPEGIFLKSGAHPRTYGNFANLLGKYVREEKIISLEEAIFRLSGLAAKQLHLKKRGTLMVGNYADIVLFDPATIRSNATYDKPHQLASGVSDVFVNGIQVLKNGEAIPGKAGRVVYGKGADR